jgi:hypothetical protein
VRVGRANPTPRRRHIVRRTPTESLRTNNEMHQNLRNIPFPSTLATKLWRVLKSIPRITHDFKTERHALFLKPYRKKYVFLYICFRKFIQGLGAGLRAELMMLSFFQFLAEYLIYFSADLPDYRAKPDV